MKNKIYVLVLALVMGVISATCFFKSPSEFSKSERRELAKMPEISSASILNGEFMKGFDLYATDQFPFRDNLRTLKALFSGKILGKKDNNGLYMADSHISKLEYPENVQMVKNAEEKLKKLYELYLKDKNVNIYLSLVPDKNYFLAEKNGYPSIDYEKFVTGFKNRFNYMEYIDIFPLLSLDDYYRTDSHWKQENIIPVAKYIAECMGTDAEAEYSVNILDRPFYGVYAGQSALPTTPDEIKYLTNDILKGCTVNYFDSGKPERGELYNMEKAQGKDAYELFLSGSSAMVEIENPQAKTDKELVIFRDSFGGSLTPLLVPAYSKVTAVDIRYIQSIFVGNFLEFDNQDVLFLYSTSLINNSMALR